MVAKSNVAAFVRQLAWAGLLGCLLGMPARPLHAAGAGAGPAPVLRLESVRLQREDREVALDPRSRLVRLFAGDRDLRVRLQFTSRGDVRWYRYRFWLEGHDPGWLEVGPPGEHRYPRLSSGSYRLRAAAAGADGLWVEAPALMLLVEPPWWRTQAALVAGGLAGLVLLTGLALGHRRRHRRRQAWRLARARQQLAEQHSEAKSRFLATLGHEIRTPMTGVLGMAELLQGSSLDPGQRAQVEAIQRAGSHLLRLVNDALDLARIEAGKLTLDDAPFELRALLQEVAGLLQPLAVAKGLGFSLHCDAGLPVALRGDATRVRQILFNLGHNAIKFCERGEVVVRVSAGEPTGLRLGVRDTGPGLGHEQRARLFRRFEQGGDREPDRYGGSGLGLAICQELAAAMGGSVSVRSEPGRGADFRVELPLPAVDAAPLVPASVPVRALTRPLRVLLVEDDAVVAEVVAGLLQRAGHQVVHAPHGLAALAELECGEFDLALLDLDLPGIDGISLARLIRGRGLRMPLMALTARVDAEAEPASRAAGMDGFLRKPVTGDMLLAAMAAVLGEPVRA